MIDPPVPSEIVAERQNLVYEDPANPWVSLYFDDVRWPDGSHGRYNRVVEGTGRPGVAVLPLVADRIGLVRVDRYPVGLRQWEIPRGFADGSAGHERDARRELQEETGWVDTELIHLGIVHLNSGLLAGHVEVFAARVDVTADLTRDGEAAEVASFPLAEVRDAIKRGVITDVVTLSAVMLADAHGLLDSVGGADT